MPTALTLLLAAQVLLVGWRLSETTMFARKMRDMEEWNAALDPAQMRRLAFRTAWGLFALEVLIYVVIWTIVLRWIR